MGKTTKIAWCRSTLNLAWGCTKVSAGCTNCYMYEWSRKIKVDPAVVRITKAGGDPIIMAATIRSYESPIFVNSMSDTFHKDVSEATLDMWFRVMQAFPDKIFQILTKRPERAKQYFEGDTVPPNIWVGTSIEDERVKSRIDLLREIDASVRYISAEPLIGSVGVLDLTGIHWVIIGGESDDKAPRLMDPSWAEDIVKQCREQGTMPFFKQMGGKGGDGAGGVLLNGRQIREMPLRLNGDGGLRLWVQQNGIKTLEN